MKSKFFLIGFPVIAALILSVSLVQNTIPEIKDSQKMQVVSIDKLARQPNLYKGVIGVSGTVKESTLSESFFILGCDDACIRMPVEYNKQLPKTGTKITAIGELVKTKEGKYVFKATDIKNEE
jgi:hypothetical protein